MTTVSALRMTWMHPAAYNRRFVWSFCLVAALGGVLFGYDRVAISGADGKGKAD